MQHSYTRGMASQPSSRRRSPTSLDSYSFSAGANQMQGWTYDLAATNAYYPPERKAGTSYYTSMTESSYHNQAVESSQYSQTAVSSYHNETIATSSSQQHYNGSYSTYIQPNQQNGTTYQSVPAEWPSTARYPSAQPSASYSSKSVHQYAAPASSTTNQPVSSIYPPSSNSRTPASKQTASSSPSRRLSNADMTSKMTRFRLPKVVSTEAPSAHQRRPSMAGEKRKERSPMPETGDSDTPSRVQLKRESEKVRVKNARVKISSDVAKLTERLPDHLRLYGTNDKPLMANIEQAVTYIDERNEHVKQLENEIARCQAETAQLKAAQAAYIEESHRARLKVHGLSSEKYALQYQLANLQNHVVFQRSSIVDKERRIGELESELEAWRHGYTK